MACATLKRSLDWDSVLGRPAKRRRCTPFCSNPTSPSQKDRVSSSAPTSPFSGRPGQSSVFPDVLARKLTPDYLTDNLKAEMKRLHRRKQLQYVMDNSDSSGSETNGEPSSRTEKALFTFKQVNLICEKMLKEKETEIREEYDSVLTAKLSEQYEAFVKFTYDQIQKNYSSQAAPSYLS